MVSFNVYRSTASGAYVEGVCLATDEKPITGIANGSILYAVDPTDGSTTRYMFDQSTATWIDAACPCSGGGSSGGGGSADSGVFIVHLGGPPQAPTVDKTYAEIVAAAQAGKVVMLQDPNGSAFGYLQSMSEDDCRFVCTNVPAADGSPTLIAFYVGAYGTVRVKTVTLTVGVSPGPIG